MLIRARQFPNFAGEVFKRNSVLSRPHDSARVFHLCYFSCESHFKFLYCSLHSIVHQVKHLNFRVWIFSDEDQPLSEGNIAIVKSLIPGAEVIHWPKSIGWGAKQIGSIWRAYRRVAEGASDNDYVVKVDSDVFFFNDTIFRLAARTSADLIGDGHFVDLKYSQGGCYFVKASAVRKINQMISELGMEALCAEMPTPAEDVAVHFFAQKLKLDIWLTWYMMFPDELRNAGNLSRWYRWKFSCLHFVMKNKSAMLEAYAREIYRGKLPQGYRDIVST